MPGQPNQLESITHRLSMGNRKAFVGAIWLTAILVGRVSAAPKGPSFEGIRSMGMGNTTVAVTTDRTALFHNPAGLGLLQDDVQFSLRPLTISIDNMFFDYVRFLFNNKDKLANIDKIDSNFINGLDGFDGYWSLLQYMPEITVATKNLGFGVYSNFPFNMRLESGHFIPKLGFKGQRDLVFTWAVGIPLRKQGNYFGISLEYLQRTPLDERISTFAETFSFSEKISKAPLSALGVVDQLAIMQHGASFDIGFMHNFKGFRIAYDVKDIFGVVGGKMVIPQLDLGAAYYFPFVLDHIKFFRNLIVAFEINDLIGFEEKTGRYEQFGKKLHAGCEIDMHHFVVRAGINQGYPTFGASVLFGPLSVDYVWFTDEAGYYAGQLPRSMHVVSLGIEINVAKRTSVKTSQESLKEETLHLPPNAPPQSSPSTVEENDESNKEQTP